ncbi:hypothetical protein HTIA_p2941 (plasmid) [Halorhabdus tiamatea SARL4B]|uniref:Abortive phage infection protein C-terminal domain-containing protein n=1 Tax=Halorhabdus tiamatea SARL4B TaxID=1033806 RepID=S6D2L2_9EURY|nr:hypothetical protein HTIA_p2941 [Halorhabdus tiamatea SARL4B]
MINHPSNSGGIAECNKTQRNYCHKEPYCYVGESRKAINNMSSETGTSPIDAISAPADNVQIPYLAHEQAKSNEYGGKYTIHHFYFQCQEVGETPISFPLDANPRHPQMNVQVSAMRDTLQNDPKDFINRNNGIVVLASDVETEEVKQSTTEGIVTFNFGDGEGVCNGGHTLLAIQKHGDVPKAVVHVEVIELGDVEAKSTSRRQEISKIADARNNNNQLEERSEANFLGYYDQYKQELNDSRVVDWHEGDPNAIDDAINAYQFFRLLKALDVKKYGHPLYDVRGKNHSSLATSVSRVHRRWKENMDDWKQEEGDPETRPLRYLTPLTNDVIYLREMVSHHLKHFNYDSGMRRRKVFQEYFQSSSRDLLINGFENTTGYDLPNPVEVLFSGLFRTNLYLSESDIGSVKIVGWFRDLDQLWAERSKAILMDLQGDFKDNDKDPKNFIRANATFTHDFYLHGMSDVIDEPPEIVYTVDEDDEARYVQPEDPQDATHELTVHNDPDEPDKLEPATGNIDEVAMTRVELGDVYEYAMLSE